MSLDVFSPIASDQDVAANAARDLPAGFSEAFDISTRALTEFHSSVNYETARDRALAGFYDEVKSKTGVKLPLYGMGGNVALEELNSAIGKLPQDASSPEPSYRPLSEGDINGMALARMRRAHDDAVAFTGRETTWGGTAGTIAGTLIGGLADPIAAATLPLGGAGEAGIAWRALEFAGIAGGTEAATAAVGGRARVAAVPGSASEIPGEIAFATGAGAVLGGALGALQKLLGAGARPLPTTVRDEVNAATSEAQLNVTNPFPGVAAEAAHRDGVVSAVTSALKGEPITAGDAFFEAWHGSPHDFDAFSIEHIGSGEGNQSFGHGLYFAENRRVSESYSRMHAAGDMADTAHTLIENLGSREAAIAHTERQAANYGGTYNDLLTALKDPAFEPKQAGNVYQVRINADQNMMLDWDKPLDQQAPKVQHAVKQAMGIDYNGNFDQAKSERMWNEFSSADGGDAVRRGFIASDDKLVSKRLSEAGIPGIKYLDQGSRKGPSHLDVAILEDGLKDAATPEDAAKIRADIAKAKADIAEGEKNGTRNFVIFDDKRVTLTHKNGEEILRPITHDMVPEVEHFDRMPNAVEDAASYWEWRLETAPPEERAALGATDGEIAARDLTPMELTKLAADPQTDEAVLRNLDRIRLQQPDADYSVALKQPDGSYQIVTRKLEDVMAELDGDEALARELEACATGLMAAE